MIIEAHPDPDAALSDRDQALSREQLAGIIASVGLAQNLTALRALVAEGIQYGHMRLHARNLALAAGATPAEIDAVVAAMIESGGFDAASAEQQLLRLRDEGAVESLQS